MLTFTQIIHMGLTSYKQVDVIYTDFSKAFDKLDHNVLLYKLSLLDLSDNILQLISSYLNDRVNVVNYAGYNSTPFVPTSGVPQGSNLGSLLFAIATNDVDLFVNCHLLMYADDMKLFLPINNVLDCNNLQTNLDNFSNWCRRNKLQLNPDKCNIMTFYKSDYIAYNYEINGVCYLEYLPSSTLA